LLIVLPGISRAQARFGTNNAKIVIEGTSNIHDWIMTSNSGNCNGSFTTDESGNPSALTNLNFIVNVTTLKSEKGSTMDNNAYKAMGAEQYPAIKFVSGSSTIKSNGGGSFTISSPGKLSISSGTRDVVLTATGKLNPDKSLTIDGKYKLQTTDYNVKPISIMLGAIKTSAEVNIIYHLVMKPQ
jgi:polyisoprenoid-binding protein YceI